MDGTRIYDVGEITNEGQPKVLYLHVIFKSLEKDIMSEPNAVPAPAITSTLDVRQIGHGQRHPLIFRTFQELKPGQAFILVVDHDPKPVLFELDFAQHGKFKPTYLEQGPEVWRIQMAKIN